MLRKAGSGTVRLISLTAICLLTSVVYSQDNRALDLQGTFNTRRLGGLPTQAGVTIKRNVLIRSDYLGRLSPADCDRLLNIGLKTVVDLRTTEEAQAWPDAACVRSRFDYFNIPLATFGSQPTMAQAYVHLFRNSGASIRDFFVLLADPDRLPLLYHCQLGKDRAGIMSALILRLLDVPDRLIMEDYLISRQTGWGAEEEWIRAVLDEVDSYGGIEEYLLSIGVSREIMQSVKANLLADPSSAPLWPYR